VAPRLADLIRKARRLAAERDRLVDSLAADWARALDGQRLSRSDLEEFWAGLTEEALRRAGQSLDDRWSAHAVRREAEEVIAKVRARVEAALGESAS
jgi:hypothetical protein